MECIHGIEADHCAYCNPVNVFRNCLICGEERRGAISRFVIRRGDNGPVVISDQDFSFTRDKGNILMMNYDLIESFGQTADEDTIDKVFPSRQFSETYLCYGMTTRAEIHTEFEDRWGRMVRRPYIKFTMLSPEPKISIGIGKTKAQILAAFKEAIIKWLEKR
jgi:hypothetical protein